VYPSGGGDTYWRCEAPAAAVGGKLLGVPLDDAKRAFDGPNDDTPFPWSVDLLLPEGETLTATTRAEWDRLAEQRTRYTAITARFPEVEGTVVWTRPDVNRAVHAWHMREQGTRTVGETDDNYFARSEQNLFLRENRVTLEQKVMHAKAMAMMAANVFSTEQLRDQYVKFMREHLGKRALPEAYVCRNHVPRGDWPERLEADGPLRVGFMGSPSHVWDVNLMYGAISAAHSAGSETVMIGYNPANPDPTVPDFEDGAEESWRSEKSLAYKRAWAKVISRHERWVDPSAYHRHPLPLDIGLAPLKVDAFTLGKSDVKLIEYTISGAVSVCQNSPVYNKAGWEHEVNCLMAGSPQEFGEQTLRLIRDPRLRYELVTAAQEYVANERNEDALALEWGYALSG